MSNYKRGRAKEYETIRLLEPLGFTCTRSASSQGLWDVVAVRADETRLIQTKYTKDAHFSEDDNCQLLRELPVHPSVRKELWIFQYGKGLVEIRDLKQPKPDARTADGKVLREAARNAAEQVKRVEKMRRR